MFTQYHFNVLAKEIRENMLPPHLMAGRKKEFLTHNAALSDLAIDLAKRFLKERDGKQVYPFDPLKWLDQCSPDSELMPLSELWEAE